ncbi:MAG: DUF5110 domain-containing protein [Armatimonadetes bacterium]|nr:DUF5110 domain-containing protein [Armatimonadota bacterium]
MAATRLTWREMAAGVWCAEVAEQSSPRLLDLAAGPPAREALATMPAAGFPLAGERTVSEQIAGRVVLRFPLRPDERLYGLGLQFRTLDARNSVRGLRMDHYGGQDNGRTHAPCPLYVSSGGYAVLVDAARTVTVHAGTAVRLDSTHPPRVLDRNRDADWTPNPVSDAVEIALSGPSVRVLVFGGPTPLDAVRRYVLYSGGGCLPPRWGLGFWHRVPLKFSDADVRREVADFREHGFPLEVLGLEPGWQSHSYPCTYQWDPERYPEPETLCRELLAQGIRLNLWENPYVSPEAEIHDALRPLAGSHAVWCGLVPDYALPEAREVLGRQHDREHLAIGVSGYKIDEVDGIDAWLWPDHATFPSGHTGEEVRQTYGLWLQKLLTELFRRRNRRTYGLVRGTNAGAAGYPYVVYSDCYDHREFIAGLCNSGFLGVLWTPEVRGAGSAEEWLRRIQSVCFSPLAMINAWADGTKPWSFPEVEHAVREAIGLRRRLLPYLYSAFARYHFDGTPPFRAMALEDPALEALDQYMMGDSLLVAPMFAGQQSRQVLLPPGRWADFYNGELVADAAEVTVTPGLERIPLFVRDGGILPLATDDDPTALEVRHYGRGEGTFVLYDDDGETYDYEQGAYNLTELRVTGDRDATTVPVRQSAPATYRRFEWRFMTQT